MRNDQTSTPGGTPIGSPIARFAKRIETTKVTVWTVLMFMVFLAMMSGLAATLGYVTHHLAKR